MLHVKDLETWYGPVQGLFGMNLSVSSGEMVSLLGRNGMGKTTTIRSIMGLSPAKKGNITFHGEEIGNFPPYRIARLGIGLVPEGRHIFPNLTVRENLLATAVKPRNGNRMWTLAAVCEFFPHLAERLSHMGNRLSGGEQQMLAIGRALMINPRLLILDEATEGLAPRIRVRIFKSLEMLKQSGLSVLIVDKNVEALTRICDRHYIIEKGRLAWQGTSDNLRKDPSIRYRYLGV